MAAAKRNINENAIRTKNNMDSKMVVVYERAEKARKGRPIPNVMWRRGNKPG